MCKFLNQEFLIKLCKFYIMLVAALGKNQHIVVRYNFQKINEPEPEMNFPGFYCSSLLTHPFEKDLATSY